MLQRWAYILALLLMILLLSTCFNNADRDNPLDPGSGKYQDFGEVKGYVYTYYAPFQPISSAMITLMPGNKNTFTDEEGAFSFKDITPGNYLVIAYYANHAPDTAHVQILANKTISIQFNLDGLPQLDTLILATGFKHEPYPFEPSRLIDCTAKVSDPDGPADIASVTVMIPLINFKDTLDLTQAVGTYKKRIAESDLHVNYIEELFGLPFFIEITDKVGEICRFGPKYLVRIIDEEPEIVSPRGSAVVGIQPILKWKSLQLPFAFTFKVEIYAISGNELLYPAIHTFSSISSDITEFQLSTILPSGLYLWTVSIIDGWGNWSRSKPATFQVGE
jgi:hypothetical protein